MPGDGDRLTGHFCEYIPVSRQQEDLFSGDDRVLAAHKVGTKLDGLGDAHALAGSYGTTAESGTTHSSGEGHTV